MRRIFVVLVVLLISHIDTTHCQATDIVPVNKEMSLDLKGKPLKEVAEDIRKQTGCTIVFDDKWKDLLISGHYTEVTVEEFFQRTLHKQNTALFYDDKDNVITIRFFDKNSKEDTKPVVVNTEPLVPAQNSEEVDSYTGMKDSDLKELHKSQQAAIELTQNDPDAFDSFTGKTNGELKELHEKQNAYMQQLRGNSKN